MTGNSKIFRNFARKIKMNKKYLLTIVLALSVCTLPLMAVVSGKSLTHTLKDLCAELQAAYQQRSGAQQSLRRRLPAAAQAHD